MNLISILLEVNFPANSFDSNWYKLYPVIPAWFDSSYNRLLSISHCPLPTNSLLLLLFSCTHTDLLSQFAINVRAWLGREFEYGIDFGLLFKYFRLGSASLSLSPSVRHSKFNACSSRLVIGVLLPFNLTTFPFLWLSICACLFCFNHPYLH